MATSVPQPTLQGIPAELRVKIYKNLFANLTLDVDSTNPGDSEYTKEKYQQNMPSYLAATAILGVSKQIRKEALPVLEDNLTLIVFDADGLKPAKKFSPGAKKVRVKDMDRQRSPAKVFREYLPKVDLITYVQARDPWWRKSLECKTWEDVFEILKGKKDKLLVKQFFTYVLKYTPGWFPNPTVLPGQSPCKVVFEFANMSISWPDSYPCELSFLYVGLDILWSDHN